MPVSVFLSDSQIQVVETAVKDKDITIKVIGRSTLELTSDNWKNIRTALEELHHKKFNIRTKTAPNMEICYLCEQVINVIDNASSAFTSADNDNKIGIVSSPAPVEVEATIGDNTESPYVEESPVVTKKSSKKGSSDATD